ncbi:MAG: SAM-dependent methyltransferase [Rhodospirillales bacterium 70-18]|nr:DUF938 domain-containing protein [Rhodospirillales bacterium]OJY63472.1 MAG: SAM-dependent methyltransferase [Rhodospirillales bacterium 70-18]
MNDLRQHSPAAARNRDAILAVLRRVLPASGLVLEVASGTGEHAAHFAAALPELTFQPSDPDPARRASIDAWCAGLPNVLPAIELDTTARKLCGIHFGAIFCANMLHIAPWAAAEGLFSGAENLLSGGVPLILYGPYRVKNAEFAPGNVAFDADLRARNPEWGIRDLESVTNLAKRSGFGAPEIVAMPANNLMLIFRRQG